MSYKENKLVPLAIAVIGGAILACGNKNNSENCCIGASNFKSQLGEDVASNATWKLVNKYFDNNKVALRANALAINQATTDEQYNTAATTLFDLATNSGNRILVAQPDGRVTFDSSKGLINNTFSKAQSGNINENHNTRPEMMSAQLTCDGRGDSLRFSSSTESNEAYTARVIKPSYGANFGTIRVSRTQAPLA